MFPNLLLSANTTKRHTISAWVWIDGLYIASPFHNTTIRPAWLWWEPFPGSAPAGVAVHPMCFWFGSLFFVSSKILFRIGVWLYSHMFLSYLFCPWYVYPNVTTVWYFLPYVVVKRAVLSPWGCQMGARVMLPLHVHARGQAHALDVSEAAAHEDIRGPKDLYCWKHNAN